MDGELKRTVIVGATPNEERYAYLAAEMLQEAGHPFVPVGIKKGRVLGEEILDIQDSPQVGAVDTLTLYVGATNLIPFHEYLLSLRPKRIIFNPGAENPLFYEAAQAAGIEVVEACTLVMIRSKQY